jgi:hypothetical protein
MIAKLSALGLAAVAALTLTVLSLSTAGANEEERIPVYFSAGVGTEETAKIDGTQIGTNTITISGSPPLTCETIKYDGEAVNPGEAFEAVLITPQYSGCHSSVFGFTRTATVVMNGCAYEVFAQETVTESEVGHFVAETAIICPAGKEIELNVYNTSNPSHTGASTLCTYKIGAQSELTETNLTNEASDVVANFNMKSIKGTGTGSCTGSTVSYQGEATIRATNKASEFVNIQVEDPKAFLFNAAKPTVKGENGELELKTEAVTVKCTSYKYEATPGVPSTPELTFKPTYSGCTAFAGKNEVQIKPESCQYKTRFNKALEFPMPGVAQTPSYFEVTCTGTDSIKVTVTKENDKVNVECTIVIPKQNAVNTLKYRNNRAKKSGLKVNTVLLIHDISGLAYEPQNNPAKCGKNEKLSDGKIVEGATKKEFLLKAFNGANEVNMTIAGRNAP